MANKVLRTLILVVSLASQCSAQQDQSTTKSTSINWQKLTHDTNLTRVDFLVDKSIAIQESIPLTNLVEGTVYLYCKESGALLDAVPIKNSYRIMIFPDPKATKYNFTMIESAALIKEGIDVALLRGVLSMNKGSAMGGPSTPFTLDVRFTAKRNLFAHTPQIAKP